MSRWICLIVVASSLAACTKSSRPDVPPAEQSADQPPAATNEPYDLQELASPDTLEALGRQCEWEPVEDLSEKSRIVDSLTELWTEGHVSSHPPVNCQLRAFRRCAPDFDGDGKDDSLVRVLWQVHMDYGAGIPCEELEPTEEATEYHFVVDARAIMSPYDDWELLALYDHSFPGYMPSPQREITDFVRYPNGTIGLRGTFRSHDPSQECDTSGVYVQSFDFQRWHPDDVHTREYVDATTCQ